MTFKNILDAENFLKQNNIHEYTFPFSDGTIPIVVDVYEDVNFSNQELSDFPVKFRNVKGNFDCSGNKLTSLDNAPNCVLGDFDCSDNNLTSLGDHSLYVGGNLYCAGNQGLSSLTRNAPTNIKGNILSFCTLTPITIGNIIVRGKIICEYSRDAYRKFLLKEMVEGEKIPRYLYQYTNSNAGKEIIESSKLKFTNPSKFNDPYDCNCPIDSNSSEEDMKNWAKLMSVSESDVKKLKENLEKDPNFIEKTVQETMNKIGICCFSTLYDSMLMWSHYAKYHTGVCLKFDITKDPDFFLTPCKVHYSHILPHFEYFKQKPEQIKEIIRTKFTDWSYESEVRIIKTSSEIQKNQKLAAKDNDPEIFFNFNKEALVEVIFGDKTTEEDKKEIKKQCKNYGMNHVKFSQMKRMDGIHYGLEKVDLRD